MFLPLTYVFILCLIVFLLIREYGFLAFVSIMYFVVAFPLSFVECYSEVNVEVTQPYIINKYTIYLDSETTLNFTDEFSKNLLDNNNYKLVKVVQKNIWGSNAVATIPDYKIIPKIN